MHQSERDPLLKLLLVSIPRSEEVLPFPMLSRLLDRMQPWIDAFAYRSAAYVNLKSTLNDLSAELIQFAQDPVAEADAALVEFCKFILPVTCNEMIKVRMGDKHDGGYVLLADPNAVGVISIGVGMNTSWDQAMASQGLAVHMFDHTIRHPPRTGAGCTFHRLGLGHVSTGSLRSIDEIIRISDLEDAGPVILKIDVEGAEWEALRDVDFTRFSQVLIELHDLADLATPRATQMLKIMEGISRTHVPVNVHANNYSRIVRFDSYWFPDVIEVSFANKSLLGKPISWSMPDDPLNSACDPRVPDIALNGLAELWNSSQLPRGV